MSKLYKVMTGLNADKNKMVALSEDINKHGYYSHVIRLKTGMYTVYVMLTRDRARVDEIKEFVEKTYNSKVAVEILDEK